MKLLAGVEQPSQGQVKLGHNVAFSYFPQNHADILKDCGEETLFEWLRRRKTGITDQEVRSVLGKCSLEEMTPSNKLKLCPEEKRLGY